jgi:uncharacterized membrane protein YhaH (DUF805 family)
MPMTMSEAVKAVLSKYATFSGRAPRSEFWWWWLFTILVQIVASIIDGILFGNMAGMDSFHGPSFLSGLVGLALFLPSLAVTVRRLHDVGRSGWWIFLGLVPLIGFLVLLYWYVQPSKSEGNRFG